ncbi:BspA family leucine-rich repeat surface protein [Mycoplasma mycoides]|uniref:BspA family leucine-rich repeat surface protein n=1 Tax=Mycoplasma mycoides TaxID=2102 RepID=UPI0003465945|nr:BspA family leucine-rich repeat surface protein [Mycoplasma mycoides]EXU60331.1 Hypothetical protein, predicted lipoprotein, DUF285 family [Mycoplasma mycoides subsp. capri PG3]QVK04250.1 BspA family leucine-rich repeat surface protein [Mycoplasma mycoides subsp. capri]
MKKVLTLLTSFSLIATSSVLVVSCKTVDIKKLFEKPKNITENSSKKDEKKLESINKDSEDNHLKNKSELGSSNKYNIFSSAEDDRIFFKEYVNEYNNWLKKRTKDNSDHFINPKDPTEILILGYEKSTNPKYGLKLKQIPKNVKKVPSFLLKEITSLESAFKDNENANIDGIEYWDTSHIKNMYQTFFGAKNFNGDITRWKTDNVSNFDYMFFGASAFDKDLSNWNVLKDPFPVSFDKYSGFESKKELLPKFKNKN